jgi:membrane-associated phospholipid phosphatase
MRWMGAIAISFAIAAGGCALAPGQQPFGAHLPNLGRLGEAALVAVKAPGTWVPLAGAALLTIDDFDEDLSDWAREHQPLFGDDANDLSHDMKDATLALWFASALAAPSESWQAKAGGIGTGAATLFVEGRVIEGLKDVVERERPDGSNDRSMPSGHASAVAARTLLTRANLEKIAMPGWARTSADVGLYGIAFATSWARVEAGKHYPTDVLVGYAIGNFIAAFAQHAFLESGDVGVRLSFTPVDDGGYLTLTVPLGR